jgi:hypothetical protein
MYPSHKFYWQYCWDTIMTIFYYVASVVTLLLAIYAAYLLIKLKKQKAFMKQTDDFAIKKNSQLESVVQSIVSISKAMQQEQCPTIEGCIRLKVLIDQLRLDDKSREPFSVFYTIYDKTEHIPTHKDWTELDKRQKMVFTREMVFLEGEYQSEIADAVDKTVEYFKEVEEQL